MKDAVVGVLWCGFVSFIRWWGTWILFILAENQSKLAKEQRKKTELWTRKEESDTRLRFLILGCAVSGFWCCFVLGLVFNAVLCCFWFLMLFCAVLGFQCCVVLFWVSSAVLCCFRFPVLCCAVLFQVSNAVLCCFRFLMLCLRCFRFLMLCVHSSYGSLRQLALDTLGNLAAQVCSYFTLCQKRNLYAIYQIIWSLLSAL